MGKARNCITIFLFHNQDTHEFVFHLWKTTHQDVNPDVKTPHRFPAPSFIHPTYIKER